MTGQKISGAESFYVARRDDSAKNIVLFAPDVLEIITEKW
jgi:hypothetical protein